MSWHYYHVHTFNHVMNGIYDECRKGGEREVTGLLLGIPCVWFGQYYVLVDGYIPLTSSSSRTHVSVLPEGMSQAMTKIKSQHPNKLIVGWYHSHPGLGIFLSDIDLTTQRVIFKEWFHVALVVDHIRGESGFFALTQDGNYTRVSHAVWRRASYGKRGQT